MGVSEYLEDLVAGIDGPRLIAIFHLLTFRLLISESLLIAR